MESVNALCALTAVLVAAMVHLLVQVYRLGCYSIDGSALGQKNKRKAAYMREYYTKNKARISSKKKQYYLNKKEERLAYQKDYYQRVVKAGKGAHR